ncbi:hypothetical protein [Pseudomonas putida]|uniref:hypothetical protein n=1 Tax=Pseudomonas putida TaxID=303 RepID=UPI0021560FFB|nr:hypothetical protein [Pseudomonas putida]
MSTFAVFGMTRDVALAEAKKRVKTSKPGKPGGPSIQLTPAQWEEAVAKYVDKLMSGEKVKQLSNMFDAPSTPSSSSTWPSARASAATCEFGPAAP